MAAHSVEQALAFLQKKSTTDGDNVFAHLSQVIQHILETKAENAVDLLETSLLLKETRLLPSDDLNVTPEGRTPTEEKFAETLFKLFNVSLQPPPKAEGEEGEPEEEPEADADNDVEVADYLSESASFEAVGVGLGHGENYNVVLALKHLSSKPNITKVRFFGKFFGRKGNYYVFETNRIEDEEEEAAAAEEDPEAPPAPKFGRPVEDIPKETEGTNANSYWACTKLGEEFTKLPDVTPLQIKTTRRIRKFFTGNFEAEVSAYPPFPGVEKNYLRAQIARIAATTVLAPKGYFVPEEAEGEEEEAQSSRITRAEEYVTPTIAELASLEAWVHQNPHIKRQGRCALYVPEVEEPEEEEEEEPAEEEEEKPEEPEEPDESPEILSSVDVDAELGNGNKAWSLQMSSSVRGLKHQVVCLRSVLWPGAYTVTTKLGFSNVYIGWGLKNSPFEPPMPPELQKEFEGELLESKELPPVPEPAPTETDGEGEGEGEEGEGEEEEEEE